MLDHYHSFDSGMAGIPSALAPIDQLAATRDLHVVSVSDPDTEALADLLHAKGARVLRLDCAMGLDDLNAWLSHQDNGQGFDSLHLYSHGQSGRFFVGGQAIDQHNLTGLDDAFQSLASHLRPGADLLIYGCSVAADSAGQTLVSELAALTGADVAASNDSTGASPGADWDLEVRSSEAITAGNDLQLSLNWQSSLALPSIAAVLGEAVVGAFAGWVVEQIMPGSSTDLASYTNNTTINLVFKGDEIAASSDPKPAPIPTGIEPGKDVTSAIYLDSSGDLVDIRLSGPGRFSLTLSGGLSNNADALDLVLKDFDATTGLSISVSPLEQSINGGAAASGVNGQYSRLFSPGYTTLNRLATNGAGKFGDIELSAAIVNTIDFKDVAIASIELDTGFTTLVDRVNTNIPGGTINISTPTITIGAVSAAAEMEVFDESPTGQTTGGYNPVTGLIDFGDINARSLGVLSLNGSISAPTQDPNDDELLTNDLRGTITVSERIGAIQAQRSALTGTIRAGSLGTVNLGRIRGEITTTDPREALNLNLTSDFRGHINAAGHLDLGFSFTYQDPGDTVPPTERIYGEVQAGGGISGSQTSLNDPILLPNHIFGVFEHTGTGLEAGGAATINGIADIAINGLGSSRWISSGNIGNLRANSFDAAMLVEAEGDIGNIEAYLYGAVANPAQTHPPVPAIPTELHGLFQAGGNIGTVRSATSVSADLRAGGSIGAITALSGGIQSILIEAGGDIGNLWAHQQSGGASKITSKSGSIGNLQVGIGDWSTSLTAAKDIGSITLTKGSLHQVTIAAGGSIGSIKVSGTQGGILGGSIVAGDDIGGIEVSTSTGPALQGVLIQAGSDAGDRLDSIQAESYGTIVRPVITPGLGPVPVAVSDQAAIASSRILAAEIGTIWARAREGVALVDTVIHAQRSNLDGISAQGSTGGLLRATVVAEQAIGPVVGSADVQGSGIADSRINANTGGIGNVSGQGGVAGGHGLFNSYLQAATAISGIKGDSNANQGDGIRGLQAYAGTYGTIQALVRGGEGATPAAPPPPLTTRTPTGSGIVDSIFKGFDNQPSSPKPGIEAIIVDVCSIEGQGIVNSTFSVKDSISSISVKAFKNSAIVNAQFSSSSGVIGSIDALALNKGSAIIGSRFIADNGDIGRLGGIVAKTNGRTVTDNAIESTHFEAANGIGAITALSRGGSSILGTTFLADSDLSGAGSIAAITANNEGQNLAASMGISGSSFEAAEIGSITVKIDDFQGGTAISGSTFTTRTATYDGKGNVDNKGTIGAITIDSLSRTGHGIDGSRFVAGAAGTIGNISVDLITRKLAGGVDGAANASSGKGIVLSSFQASSFDYDQNVWNGTIGNITVKAGRAIPTLLPVPAPPPNDQLTIAPAGIDRSYFAALAGIGNITVETMGTGIFASAFLADFDVAGLNNLLAGSVLSGLAANVPGNIGNINVRTNGRFSMGSVASIFTGAGVGNINIEVNSLNVQSAPVQIQPQATGNPITDLIVKAFDYLSTKLNLAKIFSDVFKANERFGLAAVVGTAFAALESDIGSIRLVNTGATGQTALASVFLAAGSYGPVSAKPTLRQDWLDRASSELATNLLKVFSNIKGVSVYREAFVLFVGQRREGTVADPDAVDPSALPVATVAVPGISSGTAFKEGDTLTFAVNFGSPVWVTGKPTLGLTIGSQQRQAVYSNGGGSGTLSFTYTLQPGDLAMPSPNGDGPDSPVSLAPQLSTTGGSSTTDANIFYRGSTTPIAKVTLQTIGNPSSLPIDAVKPTILGAMDNKTLLGNTRPAGSVLEQQVTFSEVVNVKGMPSIEAKIGTRTRKLMYVSGAGTDTLLFRYVLTSQDQTGAISLTPKIAVDSNIAITDLAGNPAQLSIPPAPAPLLRQPLQAAADQVAPKILGITGAADLGIANNSISLPARAGIPVEVILRFSEPVLVDGKPYLDALIGGKRHVKLQYTRGSASQELAFRYVPSKSDLLAGKELALASTVGLPLKTTRVRDQAGNLATLVLPINGIAAPVSTKL